MRFQVKDFMSRNIKSIAPDMSARDALKALIKSGMSGFPVMDERGGVIGIFTEKEILKSVLPGYLKSIGTFAYAEDSKSLDTKLAHLDGIKIRDIMRKDVPVIDENAPLAEAARLMLANSERRVIVIRGKTPVGVITRSDVVRSLAREAGIADV